MIAFRVLLCKKSGNHDTEIVCSESKTILVVVTCEHGFHCVLIFDR